MERYRGDDAGDLKRSELNELVEDWTCLTALTRNIWKSNQKVVTDEKRRKILKSNQKIVMDEELVQNVVMDEELVQNGVMDAKIDPKVVMDLSIFKSGGWNILQNGDRKLLEEFVDENESWLLIGIPSRDPFFVIQYLEGHSVSSDQHMKKLMSLRGDDAMLHATTRCMSSLNIVERIYEDEIHKRIKYVLHERADMQKNIQKMQSVSSEHVRKTTGFHQTVGVSK